MSVFTRPLVFVVAITAAALMLSVAVVSASALIAPPVTVRVVARDEGLNLWLPLPSVWLTTAARVSPAASILAELPADQRRILAHVDELLKVIASAGDAELVRVSTDSETVVVATRGKQLEVQVRSPEGDVDVRVPLRTLRTLVRLVG